MNFEKLGVIIKENAKEVEKTLTAKGYKLQKTSLARGYISRKTAGSLEPYKGIYGEGYKWLLPNYNSNRYMTVEYWCK